MSMVTPQASISAVFFPKDDYRFRKYDVVAYQQISAEALNKVDLTLEQGVDQVSNIVFAREVQGQRRKL